VSRKLVVSDGNRERELVLVGSLVVGRDPACDITYDDALLSRRHAEFVTAGNQVTVRDLGSRNGVFVNGAKIAERSLRSGDVVQIGPVRARYVADDVPLSIAPDEVDVEHTAVLHRAPHAPAAAAVPAAHTSTAPPSPTQNEDDDRTLILPGSRAPHVRDSAVRPVPVPAAAVDDDERTLLVKSPAPSPQPPSGVQPRPAAASQPGIHSRSTADLQPSGTPRSTSDSRATAPKPIVAAKPMAEPAAPAPLKPAGAPATRPMEPVAPRSIAPQSAAVPQSAPAAPQNPLSAYVFVQVLVLAVVVLVAAAVPLLVWRQDVPADRAAAAPLVWLALPVAVALIAAYWVGVQINRRFVHALAAVERNRS
jgi:hypothetical protein